jgi:16S rRNA (guanine527-N7)-methyltransferase
MNKSLSASLCDYLDSLKLSINPTGQEKLLEYVNLLKKWNAVYNLTAITDEASIMTQHLMDCLAIVNPIKNSITWSVKTVLDVGSGGGLPGIILAICFPQWQVHCVDSVGKKAAFIQQASASLHLPNLSSIHSRVEAITGSYDLITCRAFSSLAIFVQLTSALLSPEGRWCAMKGKKPADELSQLSNDVEVFHVEQLQVPGLDAQRCLMWLRRKNT